MTDRKDLIGVEYHVCHRCGSVNTRPNERADHLYFCLDCGMGIEQEEAAMAVEHPWVQELYQEMSVPDRWARTWIWAMLTAITISLLIPLTLILRALTT